MSTRALVVLCATISLAAASALADERSSASEAQAEASKTTYSYTWDELVELIPDIKEMHLVTDRKGRREVAKSGEVAADARLCRRERSPTSMIRRRVCFTLDEYVQQYVDARKYFAEMKSGAMTRGFLGEGGGATATSRTAGP